MPSDLRYEQLLTDVLMLSKKLCAFPIQGKLAYASRENFLGRVVDGYYENANDICLLTKKVAQALCVVQNDLNQQHLGLFIFDAYRPHRAVRDFGKWFHTPPSNDYELQRKKIHYPRLEKIDLARLGYAHDTVSHHNFGNTVDLTLISTNDLKFLDMGACFDFFDELSHYTATAQQIGQIAVNNRQLLAKIMQQHGFIPYEKEFWHFSYHLRETEIPIDLPIISNYKGLNSN